MIPDREEAVRSIRATSSYRYAIRCLRAAILVSLPNFAWAVATDAGIGPEQPGWLFGASVVVSLLCLGVANLVFFFHADIWSIRNDRDREFARMVFLAMLRDVFRLRQPSSGSDSVRFWR